MKTPTQLAHERMLELKYKTVYMTKPPNRGPRTTHEPGYDPMTLMVVKVGKIKSKLAWKSWTFSKPIYYSVNNKDIYSQDEWDAARLKWDQEKMWKALAA